jgi:hypothetical protein
VSRNEPLVEDFRRFQARFPFSEHLNEILFDVERLDTDRPEFEQRRNEVVVQARYAASSMTNETDRRELLGLVARIQNL